MKFEFEDDGLRTLYEEGKGQERYPPEVVRAFFRRMAVIAGARDKRDLYQVKSLHFERLKRSEEDRSIRLNRDWRLILVVDKSDPAGTVVRIREINRHYGD
ncbi:MAG: type II toxin-antitoxin system RelE/ParE family toxin [Armatimonadetes bacterium]|nr:type II toxin-antitoxin system RelE/ParE family toxin [Armatimonadota bacterium]